MWEVILAVLITTSNVVSEIIIQRTAEGLPGSESIAFLLKWNGVRILGLMCMTVSVILWAHIQLVPFVLSFIVLYTISLFNTAIRYGST